jgi:hypothetical protein
MESNMTSKTPAPIGLPAIQVVDLRYGTCTVNFQKGIAAFSA